MVCFSGLAAGSALSRRSADSWRAPRLPSDLTSRRWPVGDPKLTTLDVKPLGTSAAREIGTFSLKTKGSTPQEVTGKYVVVWEKIGNDWKLATDIWNDGK